MISEQLWLLVEYRFLEAKQTDELTARELIDIADVFISAIEEYIKVKFYSE